VSKGGGTKKQGNKQTLRRMSSLHEVLSAGMSGRESEGIKGVGATQGPSARDFMKLPNMCLT